MVKEKVIYTRVCPLCQITFETTISKKVSCSRRCSSGWRHKHIYKDRYTVAHRSNSPYNFLKALAKKKVERRNLSYDFLFKLYDKQHGKCALSGKEMTYQAGVGRLASNISIDRIDSSKGYDPTNIQLVCVQANKMKAELTQDELHVWCKAILCNLNKE